MAKYTAHNSTTGKCQVMTDLFCTSNRADAYNIKYYCTVKSTRISDPLITKKWMCVNI